MFVKGLKHVKLVIEIVDHVLYQSIVVMVYVSQMNHMIHVQRIVVDQLTHVFKSRVRHVYWIVLCQHKRFVGVIMECIVIHKHMSLHYHVVKQSWVFVRYVMKIILPYFLEETVIHPLIIHRHIVFVRIAYIL